VSSDPSGTGTVEDEAQTFCYGHPKTPTRLRCSRCDRPICGRCAIPATVGQHCPECVAEARRTAPKVRTVLQATAPATRTILILTALVFLGQILMPRLGDLLAMRPSFIIAGEWWRLVTPMLVHAGVFHLLMNGYVLYAIGPAVEDRFGPPRFVVVYVVAGIAGSVFSFAFNGCFTSGVGASGAILGLIGALAADLYRRRESPNARLQLDGILKWIGLIFAIGIALELLAQFGVFLFRIDNFAHLGGLLGGAALAWGLGTPPQQISARGILVTVLVTGVLLVMVAARVGAGC
jgi:membrane associated rhomboid family serine protease